MPAYRAFGLVIEADREIPALSGVEVSSHESVDISVELTGAGPWDDLEPGESDWHESVPDDLGHVLRVTRFPSGGFRFSYRDGIEFVVASDGNSVRARWPEDLTLEDTVEYLLGPVIAFILRMRGVVCLHACAVVADGGDRCFAVMAPSGHGKSTTAAACARQGLAVLTEDVLALEYRDGEFWATPAYPRIRLWPQAVDGLFGSPEALPRITPQNETWDKRYLDLDAPGFAYQRTPLRLAAIYTPECDETSPSMVEFLPASEALVRLIGNVYSRCRPTSAQRAREFAFLERVARNVPVKRYRGRYGFEHLNDRCALLHADCLETTSAAEPA